MLNILNFSLSFVVVSTLRFAPMGSESAQPDESGGGCGINFEPGHETRVARAFSYSWDRASI